MEIRQPSMFLDEIPKSLIEEVRLRRAVTPMRAWGDDEERVIVMDDLGERMVKPKVGGFLSSIDDL